MDDKRIKALVRMLLLGLSMPFCMIADIYAGPFRIHGEEFHTEACWDQMQAAGYTLITGEDYYG